MAWSSRGWPTDVTQQGGGGNGNRPKSTLAKRPAAEGQSWLPALSRVTPHLSRPDHPAIGSARLREKRPSCVPEEPRGRCAVTERPLQSQNHAVGQSQRFGRVPTDPDTPELRVFLLCSAQQSSTSTLHCVSAEASRSPLVCRIKLPASMTEVICMQRPNFKNAAMLST